MPDKIHIPLLRIHIGRFLFLLLTLVSLFAIRPFLEGYVGINFLMDLFVSAVLISGVYAVSEKRSTFITGLIIGLPALMTQWATYFFKTPVLPIVRELLGAIFCAYLVFVIVRFIFHEDKVTVDLINGAVCVYFLIGLMFAYIFAVIEGVHAGSFTMSALGLTHIQHFTYFSYVTLTTLGYGDIAPLSNEARSLAVLESMTGQLYLAVTIARLVGLHIAHSKHDS
jgi:hypothetical protein